MEKLERERDIKEKTIGHDAKAAKHAGELCCTLLMCNILKQSSPVAFHSSNCKP